MNILLTGATGMVGRQLRRALLARGDTVYAHTRRPQQNEVGTHWFSGDSSKPETFAAPLEVADGIVNLAGASIAQRWTKRARRDIMESRVFTTQAIGEAIKRARPRQRVWLNASAVGFYGYAPAEPCDESAPSGEGFLSDVCRAWEAAAERGAGSSRLVLLRFGIIFAKEGGVLQSLARMSRLMLAGPLGSGDQWMSWVHLQDVLRMILWSLQEQSVEGPLNVTAPNASRQKEVMAKLSAAVSRPQGLRVPAAPLRFVLGQMGEELLLGGQNVVPKKALASGYHHAYAGLEAALRDLIS